jgi:hypothetical protein
MAEGVHCPVNPFKQEVTIVIDGETKPAQITERCTMSIKNGIIKETGNEYSV